MFLFICIYVILVVLALKRPVLTILLYVAIAILPYIFHMIPQYDEGAWAIPIGFGFRTSDFVLTAMFCATAIELIRRRKQAEPAVRLGLGKVLLIACLFLAFEILRNVPEYGIAAFGEFRYTYIGLILPVYVFVFLKSRDMGRSLFKWSIAFSLFLTLVCIPLIGQLKGWDFGSQSRFLPSDISLGLFYGYLSLILGKMYRMLRLSRSEIYAVGVPVLMLVLIDGHRSVWMCIFAILVVLTFLSEISWSRLRSWLVPGLLIAGVTLVLANRFINVGEYVSQRTLAYSDPEEDQTSSWRLNLWEIQLLRFYNSPLVGEGFGAYWGLSEGKGDIGVVPHSLYVMMLAKLGLIGLTLYIIIIFKLFTVLRSWLGSRKRDTGPEYAIVLVATACLVGANVYAFAYQVDPGYSWLFVGLGLATVRGSGP